MPISLEGLDEDFRIAVEKTLERCAAHKVRMVPYFGVRTPRDQGRLWRQSRTMAQIDAKVAELKGQGAFFLADCIQSVGPQHGPRVTNAIPGYSWHQWAQALDCYWDRNGRAEWDVDLLGPDNGYRIFAHEATLAGLHAGGYWTSIKDWPHVQKRKAASPASSGLNVVEIDAAMAAKFS